MVAEVSLNTETIGFIVLLGGGLITAIVYMFKGWMKELTSQRDSYKSIAIGTVTASEKFVHHQLELKGIPVVAPLVAVVPEHNSPVSEKQQQHADLETLKARAAALVLARTKLNGDYSSLKLADDAKKLSDDAAKLSESVSKLNDADPGDEDSCP